MTLTLHNLKPKIKPKARKRIGRGGKRGTYSGRGQKGQRSRSGGKAGLKRLGLKPLMTQTHKLRGFKSIKKKPEIVNLKDLEKKFKDNDIITPRALIKAGLISTAKNGVKILGTGKLTKKITIKDCEMSKSVEKSLTQKS